mgnify:FL=1
MTTFNINYLNLLKFSFGFILIGNLARSLSKTPSSIIEVLILSILLVLALIYIFENIKIKYNHAIYFYIFLIYLLIHTFIATIYRPIELNGSFYEIFFYNVSEFRLSTLGYFLPLIFIPLLNKNIESFEKFFIVGLKFAIIYTLFEQLLSVLGLRQLFVDFYANSGVVSNLAGAKSFGMYRVWGLIGSPQLLGIFHLISLIFLLNRKENLWSILCIIAILFSTSKTAYLLLIIYSLIYLIQKKQYLLLLFGTILFSLISMSVVYFHLYLMEMNLTEDYPNFIKFTGSIHGYFLLAFNVEEVSAPRGFISGGPFFKFIEYFSNNPLEIFFGKGITYSIYQDTSSLIIDPYHYLTSDYYILTFIHQYGFVGFLLLIIIFLLIPIKEIFSKENLIYAIPIIFFLSMLHYPPQISKLMMIVVSYAMYSVYLKDDNKVGGK